MNKEALYKVDDKVAVNDPDRVVKDFVRDSIFSGLKLDVLRAYCRLEGKRKYKIVDICPSCKFVRVAVGKHYINLDFNQVEKA